jgi:acetoin utilization protein AcuB
MTRNPITIPPETGVSAALRLMREKKVRRFPVLDRHGALVGIVSDKDLLHVAPSPATTLAIWEIPELLAKVTVEKVMAREVITVSEETPLEEAARIMADNRIGGLPVMRGETVAGIITETDLFKALLQLLGGRRPGVRVTVAVPDIKGMIAKVTTAIFGVGGNIVGFGLRDVAGPNGTRWEITLKVQDVPRDKLVAAIGPAVQDVLDVREI